MADPRDLGEGYVGERRRITLPEPVMDFLGLNPGDTLVFSKQMKGRVVIRRKQR